LFRVALRQQPAVVDPSTARLGTCTAVEGTGRVGEEHHEVEDRPLPDTDFKTLTMRGEWWADVSAHVPPEQFHEFADLGPEEAVSHEDPQVMPANSAGVQHHDLKTGVP
jgi:hypothetical protein